MLALPRKATADKGALQAALGKPVFGPKAGEVLGRAFQRFAFQDSESRIAGVDRGLVAIRRVDLPGIERRIDGINFNALAFLLATLEIREGRIAVGQERDNILDDVRVAHLVV